MSLLTFQMILPSDVGASWMVTMHWGALVPPLQPEVPALISSTVGVTISVGGETGCSCMPSVFAMRKRVARARRRSAKSHPLKSTVSRDFSIEHLLLC
jgi:hypothetical protein